MNAKSLRMRAILEIIKVFGSAALILGVTGFWTGTDPLSRQAVIWLVYVITLGLIWWLLKRRGRGWKDLGLGSGDRSYWYRTLVLSVVVVVVAVMAFMLGGMVSVNLGLITAPTDMSGYDLLKDNAVYFLPTLVAVYIGSSLGEEVVFRGFLITRLQALFSGSWSNILPVVLSGILFGLVHLAWGLMGVVQTTFMGWALGFCYLRSGRNLWVTILAHAYMDTLLMVQIFFS